MNPIKKPTKAAIEAALSAFVCIFLPGYSAPKRLTKIVAGTSAPRILTNNL